MGNIKIRVNSKLLNGKLDKLKEEEIDDLILQIINKIESNVELIRLKSIGIIKSEESNLRFVNKLKENLSNKYEIKIIDCNKDEIDDLDLYLDCMFKSNISNKIYKKIEYLNSKKIVSIGLKSGINTYNGKISHTFNYCYSIYIFYYPFGNFVNYSLNYLNKFSLVYPLNDSSIRLIDKDYLKGSILKRKRYSNKGTYKRTTIIGGSKNYLGSTYLSYLGLSSLISGVGYINIATCKEFVPYLYLKNPQATLFELDSNNGHIVFNKNQYDELISNSFTIIFGIGCGTDYQIYECLRYLILNFTGNLIIDADGINVLSKYGKEILKDSKANIILTPHISEFARLINKDNIKVSENMYSCLKEFLKDYKIGVILKSSSSLISYKNKYYLNISGNSGLSKGGSGDLLTGILAGLIANTSSLEKAMCLASYLLGKSSEIASTKIPEISITYQYIVNNLPFAIDKIVKK